MPWALRLIRPTVGWGLAALVVLPLHRLLEGTSGIAAGEFLRAGDTYARANWIALLAVVAGGLLVTPVAGRTWAALGRVPWRRGVPVEVIAAGAAFAASMAFSWLALGGGPYLVDGMSQLLQARLFAEGRLAIDPSLPIEHWHFQYLAPSSAGWTSQYPPGFAAVLAPALVAGIPWLVGPAVHAATAWLGTRLARRLFPDSEAVVVLSAVLLALSPFALALSGAYMNHGLAALLSLAAVHAAVGGGPHGRAGAGAAGAVAGVAVGALVTVRPLTALTTAVAAGGARLLLSAPGRRGQVRFGVAAALGAVPLTALALGLNARLFGDPLTFGYAAAQGPDHGLGFHVDPWGAWYGPREALAYGATELRALGAELAGVPLPLTLLVGVALAHGAGVGRAHVALALWALAPTVAGLFYWHHDLSMGPRLLADAAPAWALLTAWGVVASARALLRSAEGRAPRLARGLLLAAAVAGVTASGWRLADYRTAARERGLLVSHVEAQEPALVFVHDSWESRVGARLAGGGFRDDEIRSLMARFTTCELHEALEGGRAGTAPLREALLRPGFGRPLATRVMPSGSAVRTRAGEVLTPGCAREAASDFAGVAGLPQRLWRGAPPGASAGGTLYARDLGPEGNAGLIARSAPRRPWLLGVGPGGAAPSLVPYDEGMARLWDAGRDP